MPEIEAMGSYLVRKKSWVKNIIFSWRNLILKIAKIMGNPVKSNMLRSGGEALHMATGVRKKIRKSDIIRIGEFRKCVIP